MKATDEQILAALQKHKGSRTLALGLAFATGGWVAYKFAAPCVCVVITKAVI